MAVSTYYGAMAQDAVPAITPEGAAREIEVREVYAHTATLNGTLGATQAYALVKLPADCIPIEMVAYGSILDTGSSLSLAGGIFNAAATAFTFTLIAAATFQASVSNNLYKESNPKTTLEIAASAVDRYVGIMPQNAAATRASGNISCSLTYRFARSGE